MIAILSVIIILLLVFLIFDRKFSSIVFKNLELKNYKILEENNILKEENRNSKEKLKNVLEFTSYSKAIVNYSLTEAKTKKKFDVLYEVTILETSIDKIKVAVIDFNTDNAIGSDPKNRVEVIKHLDNKWIPKSIAEPIIDNVKLRDLKLNDLGI